MRTGANGVPMFEKGVVDALLSVLRRHGDSAAVVEQACAALSNIAFAGVWCSYCLLAGCGWRASTLVLFVKGCLIVHFVFFVCLRVRHRLSHAVVTLSS